MDGKAKRISAPLITQKKFLPSLINVLPPRPVHPSNYAPQIAKQMALDSGEGSSIEAINAHMKDAYAALNNDEILKGKAQDYADTINSSHFS